MNRKPDRKLILEDGAEYTGYSFGDKGDRILEIVFNTSMVGYQEILSDPSYTDQAVVMTYPLIGNYGVTRMDFESDHPSIGALIVHEYNETPSHFRSEESLGDVMERFGIAGIQGIDTRKLGRSIRDFGSRKVLLTDISMPREEGLSRLQAACLPRDAVSRVSCREVFRAGEPDAAYHVVAVDCGMKKNIIRSFLRYGCRVTVVPWNTDAETIRRLNPDGVFLSNGPGDPQDVPETVETVQKLLGKVPVFGICLGHQILSLAYGARTYKLKFGHRGGNHPVRCEETGKVEITSQNHSYAVDGESLKNTPLRITHTNLLDGTVEGVSCPDDLAFSVQYHPESAPGPQDSLYLFDRFLHCMERR